MKKGFTALLSLSLAFGTTSTGLLSVDTPVLAAQETTEDGLPDVTDLRPTGTWGTANYYMLDDGTLYFGPGKTTSEPPRMSLSRYVERIVSHPDLDTSALTSLYGMFDNYSKLTDISGLANWNVSNVSTMCSLFGGTKITNVDALSGWEVDELASLNSMFYNCTELTDLSGMRNWGGSFGDLNGAFEGCTSLTTLDGLEGWSLYMGSADSFSSTFYGCSNLSDISALANWRVRKATTFCQMFNGCNLSSLDALANWNVSNVSGFDGMFANNANLSDISALANWNMSSAQGMTTMFDGCTKLSDISALNSWTLPTGQWKCQVDDMFKDTAVKSVDLSAWNTEPFWSLEQIGPFSAPLTKIKLSTPYMSNTTNIKEKFIEASGSDSYGDQWTNASLTGPYTAAGLYENWSDDLAGWWGRARPATFTQSAADAAGTPVSCQISLPAEIEAILPLDLDDFDLSAQCKELVGWKAEGSDEVLTSYTVALEAQSPTLTAVYRVVDKSTAYTFDANGGSGEMASLTASTTADPLVKVPACSFAKDGYAFAGWNTARDGGGTMLQPGEDLPVLADSSEAVLYAQWSPLPSHTVIFDANGGVSSMSDLHWIGTEGNRLPACTLSRADYVFAGWNTAADGSGTAYADGAEIAGGDVDSTLTLYAQWTLHLNYGLLDQAIAKGEAIKEKTFANSDNERLNEALAQSKTARIQATSQNSVDQARDELSNVLLSLRLDTASNPLPALTD